MIDQPETFWRFTATGWTAVGSIVSAVSIAVLSYFNFFYLRAARVQADAAQRTLGLLHEQLVMAERPFVAIHSEYLGDIDTVVVRAVSQGSGPALDVRATLRFNPGAESGESTYVVGCLAAEEKFWFQIGQDSKLLTLVELRYRSISGRRWLTTITTVGGHPVLTKVEETPEVSAAELAFSISASPQE